MKNKNRKSWNALIALAMPLCFAACGQSPTDADPRTASAGGNDGMVKSTITLGKVGMLSKSSAITLQRLVLTAVSSAVPADTVRDTVAVSGSEAVTVLRTLTLKPLRNWVLHAKTLDALDSVIHSGASAPFLVNPSDTTAVSLTLASRFSMYQANFNSLPDSIAASQAGTGKDKLNLKRVVMKVDGVVRGDSVSAAGYFAGGQNITVAFDYVAVGSHTVVLEAYGDLHSYSGILYTGTTTLNVSAGDDDTRTVTLDWVGPTTGTGSLTVVIGKVGKVIMNGSLPGTVL